MSDTPEQGIYINGKQQIIEMLQYMNESDRKKLLHNIRLRNATMARELSEQSLSFKDLVKLPESFLNLILSKCNPAIIGLALYNVPVEFQRKALSAISRELAEQAFNVMSQDLSFKKQECKRAQEKIVQIAIGLSKRNQIQI